MFTGIVEEVGKVLSAQPGKLSIAAKVVLEGTKLGDSIAVNGVCLTVTKMDSRSFSVDIMAETLRRSNLAQAIAGTIVNLERPMTLGGKLGGHLVEGHVDGLGRISSVKPEGKSFLIDFEAPPEVTRYVVEKGFIAVDGISLTVTARTSNSVQVSVVQYTQHNTTLGQRRVGDAVNLEVDIIAKYVEQFSQLKSGGITSAMLKEHGYLE